MNFKEHVLMELKAEIEARNGARSRRTRRRLLTGTAVAAVLAAAAVATPFLNGSDTPAYAVSKNTDGTITLKINEFQDPGQVEKDLAALGLPADVSYLKPGTRCAPDRAPADAGPSFTKEELQSKDPAVHERIRKAIENSPNAKTFRLGNGQVQIDPKRIKPGQTAVMEFTEDDDQTSGPEKPRALWQFGGFVVDGPAKPCKVIDDPSWDQMPDPKKHPEAYPPSGK
ncbi:hypothetical protein [Nonomuraea sp. NPDC049607]|uniref:hypothetical protein n=1 Tax=Nonomuraea sp. NPDC049607 TaxID=3154732 RepID=UPI003446CC0A